jgi:hypothetical protein
MNFLQGNQLFCPDLQGEDLRSLSDIDDLASTFSKVKLLDIDNCYAVTEECNFLFLKTYDMKCPRDLYLSGVSIWKR